MSSYTSPHDAMSRTETRRAGAIAEAGLKACATDEAVIGRLSRQTSFSAGLQACQSVNCRSNNQGNSEGCKADQNRQRRVLILDDLLPEIVRRQTVDDDERHEERHDAERGKDDRGNEVVGQVRHGTLLASEVMG